jgi:hypothetical protein
LATDTLTIGPFTAIWVGDADDTDVLERINLERTGGGTLTYSTPEAYLDCVNNTVQAGRAALQVTLRFASTDAEAIKLAMGNLLSATNADDPSAFAQYAVVLLHPDTTRRESIYIPRCWTKKELNLGYTKNDITSTPIQFQATNRDRFTQLFYRRTKAEIATLLDTRSPF